MREKNTLIEMDADQISCLLSEVDNFLDYLISENFDERIIAFAFTKRYLTRFSQEQQTLVNSLHPIFSALNEALTENIMVNKSRILQ